MRIRVLGPLEVEGTPGSAIRAAKERSLLATLALSPRTVVSSDALVAALWGENFPASARKTLQTYVWNLRQALGDAVIETEAPGYVLQVDEDDVDVVRFRSLVRRGEAALAAGDAAQASERLREALALWRGEPFAGVAEHTGLAAEAVRLKEELVSALELRLQADLELGRHAEIVGELDALADAHPYRERLVAYLMLALYRCGRQVDALATYEAARERLVEELGLEPGGELRRMQAAILHHDPSLEAPARSSRGPGGNGSAPPLATLGIARSPVRYARSSDGVNIAYQVAGRGPVDILAIPGFVTHLDIWWNAPTDGLVRRLSSIGRLISFDKRGMGLSDRPESIDALRWVDDALAVLDAVGARDVIVLGISAGTPTAIRLAALHPDRVRGLVVFGGGARTIAGPGYEIGHERALLESFAANLEQGWGTGVAISAYAPSRAAQPHVRDYWARYQQLAAAPAAAIRYFWACVESDVTDLLPAVSVPTLVLHPERDLIAPVAWGQYLAEQIPGAQFVALDSDVDLICVSDVIDEMAAHIGHFIEHEVTGRPPVAEGEAVLRTVVAVELGSDGSRAGIEAALAAGGGEVPAGFTGHRVVATFASSARALRCAAAMVGTGDGRVGLHVGECVPSAGGDAVDVAVRLAEAAAPGEVLLTRTVRDVASSVDLEVEPRAVTIPGLDLGVVALVGLRA